MPWSFHEYFGPEPQPKRNMNFKANRTKRPFVALPALCAALIHVLSLNGATFTDANWISMGGFPGVNGIVYAAVVDGSGNLYIGGHFTVAGDVFANYIAKWNG